MCAVSAVCLGQMAGQVPYGGIFILCFVGVFTGLIMVVVHHIGGLVHMILIGYVSRLTGRWKQ